MSDNGKTDGLINRLQMVDIAHEHKLFVSRGTIHRWANEPDFPLPIGKEGKFLLYSCREYEAFLVSRINKIQMEH